MQDMYKERIKSLEKSLEWAQKMEKLDSCLLTRFKYRFFLDTYMLNIKLLSRHEIYKPLFK